MSRGDYTGAGVVEAARWLGVGVKSADKDAARLQLLVLLTSGRGGPSDHTVNCRSVYCC